MRIRKTCCILAALIALSAIPTAAQDRTPDEMALEGWGLRVGLATEPDQLVGGVHFDLGEIVDRLRFEPSVELGVGDDHTVLAGAAAVHYLFDVDAAVDPFFGGGVAVAWVDRDKPAKGKDDSEVEIAIKLAGGVEWKLRNRKSFRLELGLFFGDLYDAQILAGWTF